MKRVIDRIAAILPPALLTAALLAAAPLTPARAQSDADAAAIQETIRAQIEAFQADDWERAFTFASPNIQSIFRNPENFSRMVTNGFPMVWRPKTYDAGALTDTPAGLQQTMLFEDQQGRLFIADYTMQLVNGEWRINGVQIRPAPEQSV